MGGMIRQTGKEGKSDNLLSNDIHHRRAAAKRMPNKDKSARTVDCRYPSGAVMSAYSISELSWGDRGSIRLETFKMKFHGPLNEVHKHSIQPSNEFQP